MCPVKTHDKSHVSQLSPIINQLFPRSVSMLPDWSWPPIENIKVATLTARDLCLQAGGEWILNPAIFSWDVTRKNDDLMGFHIWLIGFNGS